MAQKNIIIGSRPNDGSGDTIRNAFIKTNDNFTELYEKYDELINSNSPDFEVWQRPSDWLQLNIPSDSEQRFTALYAVSNTSYNYCAFTVEGDYTVNWGDGTVQNFSSGVKAEHQYDFNDIALDGTLTSAGFKQAIITVTPQTGNYLTSIDLGVYHSFYDALVGVSLTSVEAKYLDIAVAGSGLTTLKVRQQGTANVTPTTSYDITYNLETDITLNTSVSFNSLHQLYIGKNSITSLSYAFSECKNLKVVERLDLFNVSCFAAETFSYCDTLQTVKNFNITSEYAYGMFSDCYSLKFIVSDKIYIKYLEYMFYNCINLKYFKVNNFSGSYICDYMFDNCYSLKRVCIFKATNVVSFYGSFSDNRSLLTATILNTDNLGDAEIMFSGCHSLVKVKFTDTPNLYKSEFMFENCYSLKTVENINFTNTNFYVYTFYETNSLESINLNLQSESKQIVFNDLFYFQNEDDKGSIKEFIFGTFSPNSSFADLFTDCYNLKKVNVKLTVESDSAFAQSYVETTDGIDCSQVESGTYLFDGCTTLLTTGDLDFSSLQWADGMFRNCVNLNEIGNLNFSTAISAVSLFEGCINLTRSKAYGIKVSHSYENCYLLTGTALNEILTNLGTPVDEFQSINLTNVLGTTDPLFNPSIATSKGWSLTY